MIRIVGLSATLPNYADVAAFLGVNVDTGLFFFDASYRPVPLEMQFVGVTAKPLHEVRSLMDTIAYNKVGAQSFSSRAVLFGRSKDDVICQTSVPVFVCVF